MLSSGSEFPDPREFAPDTVVLDLPERVRLAAFQQVRERYSGRMIVTVSSERETEGWSPDPACWFLVRPFGANDVMQALWTPVPHRANTPAPRLAEAATQPAPRLSSEESLWEAGTGATPPPLAPVAAVAAVPASSPPPFRVTAARDGPRRPSRRALLELVGALVLMVVTGLGGIAIGRASASPDRIEVSAIPATLSRSATSQPSLPTTGKEVLASPASCLSALDRSDAAISYLVGNVRDKRLSRSMQQYQADRRACREQAR